MSQTTRINWNSEEGLKVIAFVIEQRKNEVPYKKIAEYVNENFNLPRIVDDEDMKHLYRRKKNVHIEPEIKQSIKDDLKEFYEEMEEEIEYEFSEEAALEMQEEAIREAKEKARKEQERKLLNRLLKERGTTELIVETFEEGMKAYEWMDIQPPKPVYIKEKESEEALLLFSDAQIGQRIDPKETQGFGEYNIQIFQDRMDKLVDRMRTITESQKLASNIETLNIFMLGDNVDGIGIYRGQEHHLDALVVEQLLVGAEKIAESLVQLLGTFDQIKVTGIVGNHGRIGRKGENPTHVNFDYLLYKMLEKMLQNYSERITWTIPKSNWILQEILGNGFLLLHGDTIRAWNGIPYYGIDRADARLTKMLQAHGKTYKYLCLGHHHNPGDVDSPNGEKILNGTMVGGSEYSINQLHTTSRPSQWFFGVNKKEGITWRYKILLDI